MDPIIRLLLIDSGQIDPEERFYQIEDFPNYFISPAGKVYSSKTKMILNPWDNQHYDYVTLRNSEKKTVRGVAVHTLVAKYFVCNFDNKPEVHHIDNNPKNNHFTNLMYVTKDENLAFQREAVKKRGSYRNPTRKRKNPRK